MWLQTPAFVGVFCFIVQCVFLRLQRLTSCYGRILHRVLQRASGSLVEQLIGNAVRVVLAGDEYAVTDPIRDCILGEFHRPLLFARAAQCLESILPVVNTGIFLHAPQRPPQLPTARQRGEVLVPGLRSVESVLQDRLHLRCDGDESLFMPRMVLGLGAPHSRDRKRT